MLDKILHGLFRFVHRWDKRICCACGHVIEGEAFVVEGHAYCDYFEIPAVIRARAAGVKP